MKLFSFGAGLFFIIASGSWLLAYAISKRQIYQEQLKNMALNDTLTELPSRRLFFDRLIIAITQSKRYKNEFGLLYID